MSNQSGNVGAGHTPGPWYATGELVREAASDAIIADAKDGDHVDPSVEIFDSETREANARRIAHTNNTYEELVGALRDLLPYARAAVPNPIDVGEENVISKAERVLKLAEGR